MIAVVALPALLLLLWRMSPIARRPRGRALSPEVV
jgi:hypothetical protein